MIPNISISKSMIYTKYHALIKLTLARASIENDIQSNSITNANKFSEYGFTYVFRTDG